MKHARTFRIDRLYHKFLKPQGMSSDLVGILATRLQDHDFIAIHWDDERLLGDRYEETEKLTNRKNKDELFKLINEIKKEYVK